MKHRFGLVSLFSLSLSFLLTPSWQKIDERFITSRERDLISCTFTHVHCKELINNCARLDIRVYIVDKLTEWPAAIAHSSRAVVEWNSLGIDLTRMICMFPHNVSLSLSMLIWLLWALPWVAQTFFIISLIYNVADDELQWVYCC
jgi:hypothetical protein